MKLKSIKNKLKIIVILGPTATGKSDLAVRIAKKVKGEVISTDSRQVYKGLNIGTGKITKSEMKGVPHHLLDVISPKKIFSVSEWQKLAEKKIEEIIARGHTPIIVGGTGLYIQSIVDGVVFPEVPPNPTLRMKLSKKSVEDLFHMLKKIDSRRAQGIVKEQGDKNPVRLIRAIEIASALGKVPAKHPMFGKSNKYDFIQIGLTTNSEALKKRIHTRLFARIREGMIMEARKLHTNGLSYKRMRALGLEYRYLADFLENKISKKELGEQIERGNFDYAKRQMTWFKRDKRIHWFDAEEKGLIKKVLKKLYL